MVWVGRAAEVLKLDTYLYQILAKFWPIFIPNDQVLEKFALHFAIISHFLEILAINKPNVAVLKKILEDFEDKTHFFIPIFALKKVPYP